jgi:hypothetical protein
MEAEAPRDGVAPPAPSLLGPLIGHIKAMEEHLHAAVATLTDLSAWDASATSHTGLQGSVEDVRRMHDDWHRGMLTHLQSLWFSESATYNDYRLKMEKTLAIRHRAELDHSFPRLRLEPSKKAARAQETDTDVLARVGGSMEYAKYALHLARLGFDYDMSNSRLQLLVQRQLNEQSVFDTTVLKHTDRLVAAKRIDLAKLRGLLDRTEQSLEAMLAVVEKKIAAAHQIAQTDKLYASAGLSSSGHHRISRSGTGNSTSMRPSARPPTGSALDG